MRRIDDVSHFPGFASSSLRIPIQIVGTPAVEVTFSSWNASSRLSPSRNGPGKTCFAPTNVHVNGKPQAFAWNMGTTVAPCPSPSRRARPPSSRRAFPRRSRGASTRRPSAAPSCRSCSTWPRRPSRRSRGRRGHPVRRSRAAPRTRSRRPASGRRRSRSRARSRRARGSSRRAARAPCPRSAPCRPHGSAM